MKRTITKPDMDRASGPRERCYTVVDPKRIRVAIASKAPLAADSHVGELKEISPTSAILMLPTPPTLRGECQISIASSKIKTPILISARVDWMRPNPAGSWQVGCAIDPPLGPATFKRLLNSGLLERRAAPREPVRISVRLQLENTNERIPAIVRNISEGGLCCLATNCPPQETRHVNMYVQDSGREVLMPLKVRWTMQTGGDHFLGCQFVRQTDFSVLRDLQRNQLEIDEHETVPTMEHETVTS
jgi:hypothetical protein